jgi:hypothetical protein
MIFISPTSCREQLPDPEFFAQCIRDSFQELLALTTKPKKGRKKKTVVKKAAAKRKTVAKGRAAAKRRAA